MYSRRSGHSLRTLSRTFSILIAASCVSSPSWAQQNSHEYSFGTSFTHVDRSHRNNNLDVNILTLRLAQKLSADRSQFFSVSGAKSDSKSGRSSAENKTLGASYGQILKGETPGRTYSFAVHAGKGWNDNTAGLFTDPNGAFSTGFALGIGQTFMVAPKDALTVGSTFGFNYIWVDGNNDSGEGSTLIASPYVQYNRVITTDLGAFARLTATYSDESVSMSGKHALYTPSIGASYSFDSFRLNGQYSKEFASKHDGDIFGISISRDF